MTTTKPLRALLATLLTIALGACSSPMRATIPASAPAAVADSNNEKPKSETARTARTSESPRQASHQPPRTQQIARSIQGRPIDAITLGAGPRRIYLIAGIHGDEPEGQAAVAEIIDRFSRDPRCTLRLVRDMNPDGTHASMRTNAAGVDLNRNWPARNFRPGRSHGPVPLSEPETSGVHDDLHAFAPDLVVVFHSATRAHAPFVNFDGPASDLAAAFADAAKPHAIAWSVVPSMGYPTPGSLGSYLGIDLNIPILTIEFQRGQRPASAIASAIAGLDALAGELALP